MATQTSNEPAPGAGAAAGAPLQLLALLGIAGVLRAYQIDSPLWYDEIVTLVEYVRLSPGEILATYTSTNNHLLYSLLAHVSVDTFGENPWALRLPAAALGVGSLAAFWWLAHEFLPAREARLASWGVALSYHHLWFSQNARGYTGILLFAWFGTALLCRLRRGGPRLLWLPYALSLALAAWIHLSSLVVFAAHGVVIVAEQIFERLRTARPIDPVPFGGFALGLLATLLLYAPVLPELTATLIEQSEAGSRGATVTAWKNPLWTLLEIARGLPIGPASLAAVAAAAVAAAAGLIRLARVQPFDALLLVLPGALTLAVLLIAGFNIWPRYFLVSLGFAALLAVHGVFVTARFAARRAGTDARPQAADRAATAVCAAVVALSAVTSLHNYRYPKQDYPAARAFVLERSADGAPIRTAGLANYAYGRYYEPTWRALESVEQLSSLAANHPEFWVVYSFPTHLAATNSALFARLEQDFEPVRRFRGTLGDGDVRVLRWTSSTAAENAR